MNSSAGATMTSMTTDAPRSLVLELDRWLFTGRSVLAVDWIEINGAGDTAFGNAAGEVQTVDA